LQGLFLFTNEGDFSMKPAHRYVMFIVFLISLIAILSISFFAAIFAIANNNRIVYGVYVGDIKLSSLSHERAIQLLTKQTCNTFSDKTIALTYNDKKWELTPAEIDLSIDIEKTVDAAFSVGRSHSIITNTLETFHSALYGHPINLVSHYNDVLLKSNLASIGTALARQSKVAACYIDNSGHVKSTPAVVGKKLDMDAAAASLSADLQKLKLPRQLELPVIEEQPAVTNEDLKNIDTVLAVYSTSFSNNNSNRSQNIRIAAEALDQTLLRPEAVVSFNDTVGKRVASAGYKDAAVILDGKIAQDIGGGVCQVSSTLYNAILLAGLTSVERTAHFYPSSYVPMGRDATVADGQIDFRFRNPFPHNAYLLSKVYGGTLIIYILGNHEDLRNYALTTNIEKPSPGAVVSVYRILRKNGQELQHEFLHTDHYDIEE
jgi:vancomycin resistance protein YoaR